MDKSATTSSFLFSLFFSRIANSKIRKNFVPIVILSRTNWTRVSRLTAPTMDFRFDVIRNSLCTNVVGKRERERYCSFRLGGTATR